MKSIIKITYNVSERNEWFYSGLGIEPEIQDMIMVTQHKESATILNSQEEIDRVLNHRDIINTKSTIEIIDVS